MAHLVVVREASVLEESLEELEDLLENFLGAGHAFDDLQDELLNANPNEFLLIDLIRVVVDRAVHQGLQQVRRVIELHLDLAIGCSQA